jgi:hypothetical protein
MRITRLMIPTLLGSVWLTGLSLLLTASGDVPSASATMSCDYSGGCGGGGGCSNTTCSPSGTSCTYYNGVDCWLANGNGNCMITRCP